MSSLKEQRERLLQAKMREMANIGVTKRTADNIPDFDEPIDLDEEPTLEENPTLEEECNAVSETEETTASTPTTSPQAFQRHSSKRKQSDKEEKKPSSSTLEFAAYEERFLTSVRDGRNKSGFSIHTEVLQLLRNVVSDLRVETSITSYIENIILDHLKTHQELLNQIASQRRRDKTIDL
ncbi:DUF3408 domain-containing protein [Porphyromonas asaccharolytica]|uniref:DUF3408 domain-containing protein n=1 Tax=Porphyromonas asaccharolytica TaxID=28123 RepID=UPI00248DDDC4|nr:DUF3408 domain-containing protein [Porphyromonas asaccharolytica]